MPQLRKSCHTIVDASTDMMPGFREQEQGIHNARRSPTRLESGSVAVFPLGPAVFFEAIVDPGDDPRDQVPTAGFRRIYTSHYYSVYANC